MSAAETAPCRNPTAPPTMSISGGSAKIFHPHLLCRLTLTAIAPAAKKKNELNTIVHRITPIHTSRMVVKKIASVEPNELTPPIEPPGMIEPVVEGGGGTGAATAVDDSADK